MGFTCAARTHPGLRRKHNEDAMLSRPDAGLWVVADGMGGHEAGDLASGMIVDALGGLSRPDPETVAAKLRTVNDTLMTLAADHFAQRTIGSTAVALLLEDRSFRCLWVGDSRAYLLRGGELSQMTRDHSLVQELVDAGMLDPADAERHPNANVVTRAVGASDELVVDVVGGTPEPEDIFLLASDGLTKVVADDELESLLSSTDIEGVADLLIERTLERGAPDNVTVILVRVA